MDRAAILPNASSLRLMGVMSRVAMVPRSFSPAMDSAVMAMQEENMRMIRSRGMSMENSIPVRSSSVATSKTVLGEIFTSKRLAMEDSRAPSRASRVE